MMLTLPVHFLITLIEYVHEQYFINALFALSSDTYCGKAS